MQTTADAVPAGCRPQAGMPVLSATCVAVAAKGSISRRLWFGVAGALFSWIAGLSLPLGAEAEAPEKNPAKGTAKMPPDALSLRVGYAHVDITPPLGVSMPGYFHDRKASGVLDPLLAKALVLTRNDTTVAIVALDLIGIPASVAGNVRTAVEKRSGIPAGRIFVHATHTHTGAHVQEIAEGLPGLVATAVEKAMERRVAETSVRLGSAQEKSVAFIRRYLMRDGTIRTNPGRGNPGIVRPVGEIDPTVHVISFDTARTILASYGLHCDCVGGTEFAADYPYHLTQAVREKLGKGWNVLYLNACCGNVNHINVGDRQQRSGYEESRRIGRTLAGAVLAAREDATGIDVDRLEAATETVRCRVRPIPAEVYEWAKLQTEKDPDQASRRKFNELTPSRILQLAKRESAEDPAEIVAVVLGPVGIVGLPAEVFVEIGRDIKSHSVLSPTLTIGLTGGSMGYLPHPRGYQEGGYEATYSSARYAPETGWTWSDAAVQLLKSLTTPRESPEP